MQESEVIIINGIPEQIYNNIVDEAFAYAVKSIAFTYNRLKRGLIERIEYITSGKISESIICFFLRENGIVIDTECCKTPYEIPDRNDFMYDGVEYDTKCYKLKNQSSDILNDNLYTNLPAAIMQGQFKNITYNRKATSAAFIFMFHRKEWKPVFNINIPNDVASQIDYLYKKYYNKGIPIETKDRMQINSFPGRCQIKQNYYFYYIITAYANLVYDGQKFSLYDAYRKGRLNFGKHFSIIKNNFICPLTYLDSFASLFPHQLIKRGMKYGVFKTNDYSSILQPPVITADSTPIESSLSKQL